MNGVNAILSILFIRAHALIYVLKVRFKIIMSRKDVRAQIYAANGVE